MERNVRKSLLVIIVFANACGQAVKPMETPPPSPKNVPVCGNTLAPQASCTMVYKHSQIPFGGILDETLAISAGGAHGMRLLQWFSDLQVSTGALSLANGVTQTVTITNVSSDKVLGLTAYS
jgi:hypothetical protein